MRKESGLLLIALALLGGLPGRGEQVASAALPCRSAVPGLDQRIPVFLRPAIENRDFQGVVLVACGDATVYRAAFSPKTMRGVPATGHERFAIGSVAKTFTAAAILKLAQEDRLHLSDPLSKFLPGFPHGGEITIEQLLGHSAGVRDYHVLEDFATHRKEPISLSQLVEVIGRAPLDFAPGTKSGYSSSGYALLARVVEVVSGRPFHEYLQATFFEPLGLRDTGWLGSTGARPAVRAGQDPGFPPSLLQAADESHPDWLTGSGSLVSSAEDLLTWYRRFAAGDVVRWSELSYPYGWSRREERGQQVLGQDGRIPGYATNIAGYPRDGVIVIVLANVQTGALEAISKGLVALALGEPATSPARRRLVHLPEKSLGPFTGRYEMAPGNVLTVRKAKRGLELASSDGVFLPLDALGKDHFYYRALSADIRFEAGPSGVAAMSWSGFRIPRAAGH
ncbi:MAG TPA: serine hydrolase domain-containing protein [Thermoanaerobaculia bacterium]|jgi:CubicO group peptidase (beta-lactamase class C family)|nr:serine hydrolase domain-containing protein [Thermoanaerobaculia bacterium]